MLETPSLEAWSGDEASRYRQRVDYSAVFIPTDRNWDRQLASIGAVVLTEQQRALVQDAIFTSHVLWSLVAAMEYRVARRADGTRPHRPVELSRDAEGDLARELAYAWRLELRISSLASVRMALRRRMLELQQLATKEQLLSAEGRGDRIADAPGIGLNYQDAAAVGIEYFNDLSEEPQGRWALMFDELEFAPERIREQLIASLRSTDARFLFKLSLAPHTTGTPLLGDLMGAMSGHDFITIPLFYGRKEEGFDFARRLADGLLARQEVAYDAEHFLGRRSLGAEPQNEERMPTNSGTVRRRLKALEKKDSTFAKYLAERDLTPDSLVRTTANERASELRKILPLVAVRNEFLRSADARGVRRVRALQSPTVYSGDVAVFAMLESNPRNLTGVLTRLVSADPTVPAPPARQVAEVRKVQNRFRALLSTVPTSDIPGRRTSTRGLLSVVDAIGEFMQQEVLLTEFSADPPGTFVLDSAIDDGLLESLGVALNAGAIVYVPEEGQEPVPNRLRGNKYRLSYLFSPRYGLPIRLGRERHLSGILATPSPSPPDQERLDLGVE